MNKTITISIAKNGTIGCLLEDNHGSQSFDWFGGLDRLKAEYNGYEIINITYDTIEVFGQEDGICRCFVKKYPVIFIFKGTIDQLKEEYNGSIVKVVKPEMKRFVVLGDNLEANALYSFDTEEEAQELIDVFEESDAEEFGDSDNYYIRDNGEN